MKKTNLILANAIAGVLALATTNNVPAADNIHCAELERCYGVSKAGKNDCATATTGCSTSAKADFQKDAWIYVPKGTCAKLAGGLMTPPAAAMPVSKPATK
jgi:uncharacterized membrane protein